MFRPIHLTSSLLLLAVIGSTGCRTASGRVILDQQVGARTDQDRNDELEAWPAFDASDTVDPEAAPTWKECAPISYAFIEHVGDPRLLGDAMRQLFELGQAHSVEATGPPFALFFDDPAKTPLDSQRSRACLPIAPGTALPATLRNDRLESRMVAFQQRTGQYSEAPLVIPALMQYLREHGWSASGPVREVYLVDPGVVRDPNQLVCEIQVPWSINR